MNQLPSLNVATGSYDDIAYDPEQGIKSKSRIAMIALAVLVFVFGLAAAIIPIGGAVIGTGQLGVETKVKRIAHPTGGVISEIHVKDGDRVEEGDLLVRLDTTVTGVSADLSGRTVDQLLAQRARLEAEREGRATLSFPPELVSRGEASAREAMAAERRLFALRRQERASLRSQLAQRISALDKQNQGFRAQIAALQQQQALIEPERAGVRDLWEKDLVTINRLNQLERDAVAISGQIGSLQAQIAQTEARISETREQMISLEQSARSEAGTQLAQVTSVLNEQTVQNVSADDAFERSAIRAPYDGTVDKMQFATLGGVVQPAETIMEIVPVSDRLVVEAAISPADIDRVQVGQLSRVRFSAFSAQTTPEFAGKVTFVSAERTTDESTGASFYRVRVEVDEKDVQREELDLVPGMPAEVYISTGSRSMLSYITKPLRDQIARAFRD